MTIEMTHFTSLLMFLTTYQIVGAHDINIVIKFFIYACRIKHHMHNEPYLMFNVLMKVNKSEFVRHWETFVNHIYRCGLSSTGAPIAVIPIAVQSGFIEI